MSEILKFSKKRVDQRYDMIKGKQNYAPACEINESFHKPLLRVW